MASLYLKGYSIREVASRFNYSPTVCRTALRKFKIPGRTKQITSRRYALNESFFSKIDSEEKAYWLGFISADGCITGEYLGVPSRLVIGLAIKDIQHLQKFKVALHSEFPIREVKKGKGCVIEINSKALVADLVKHGVVPRKSLILKPVQTIPLHLERHYWRGFVDGDGGLSFNSNGWRLYLVGTEAVVKGFQNFCLRNGIQDTVKPTLKTKSRVWHFTLNRKDFVLRIAKLLWGNSSIFLDRKFSLYLKVKKYKGKLKSWLYLTKQELEAMRTQLGSWKAVAFSLNLHPAALRNIRKRLKITRKDR